jgi:hypothetical protein
MGKKKTTTGILFDHVRILIMYDCAKFLVIIGILTFII